MQYLNERINLLCAEAAYSPNMEVQLFVPKDSHPDFLLVVNFLEGPCVRFGEGQNLIEQHLKHNGACFCCHGWTKLLSLRRNYPLAALLVFNCRGGNLMKSDFIRHTLTLHNIDLRIPVVYTLDSVLTTSRSSWFRECFLCSWNLRLSELLQDLNIVKIELPVLSFNDYFELIAKRHIPWTRAKVVKYASTLLGDAVTSARLICDYPLFRYAWLAIYPASPARGWKPRRVCDESFNISTLELSPLPPDLWPSYYFDTTVPFSTHLYDTFDYFLQQLKYLLEAGTPITNIRNLYLQITSPLSSEQKHLCNLEFVKELAMSQLPLEWLMFFGRNHRKGGKFINTHILFKKIVGIMHYMNKSTTDLTKDKSTNILFHLICDCGDGKEVGFTWVIMYLLGIEYNAYGCDFDNSSMNKANEMIDQIKVVFQLPAGTPICLGFRYAIPYTIVNHVLTWLHYTPLNTVRIVQVSRNRPISSLLCVDTVNTITDRLTRGDMFICSYETSEPLRLTIPNFDRDVFQSRIWKQSLAFYIRQQEQLVVEESAKAILVVQEMAAGTQEINAEDEEAPTPTQPGMTRHALMFMIRSILDEEEDNND